VQCLLKTLQIKLRKKNEKTVDQGQRKIHLKISMILNLNLNSL